MVTISLLVENSHWILVAGIVFFLIGLYVYIVIRQGPGITGGMSSFQ